MWRVNTGPSLSAKPLLRAQHTHIHKKHWHTCTVRAKREEEEGRECVCWVPGKGRNSSSILGPDCKGTSPGGDLFSQRRERLTRSAVGALFGE